MVAALELKLLLAFLLIFIQTCVTSSDWHSEWAARKSGCAW